MSVRRYRLHASTPAPVYRIDYEGQLNPEQRAVVEAPSGPLLVIAGAGSGKTRTLIFRLARMLESGIPPEQIVLLTFTNRAAREMLRRAEELVSILPGIDVRRIAGGTFHHVGAQILREHASLLGFTESFGILDEEDQKDLIKSCIAELGLGRGKDDKRFPLADVIADLYSHAVNTQRDLREVIFDRKPAFAEQADGIVATAARYVERKAALNLMDFDDLLLQWKRLVLRHPEVRSLLQERYRCVLVDEYQDTNRLQAEIVELLAAKHRNLTVVGDDAQSIYSFRGANFANILEFPARHPGCSVHKLTVNYRSTPEILRLANASIACNQRQYPKALVSARQAGSPLPAIVPARDANQQAAFVAQRILELRDEGIPLEEMAILYRAHAHSMEIQIELSRRGIPFVVRSGKRFFEQAHIKDVIAFLRVVANPRDELAFKRVVRLFPGVGAGSAELLWSTFLQRWELIFAGSGAAAGAAEKEMSQPADVVPSEAGEGTIALFAWEPARGLPAELAPPKLAQRALAGWERCFAILHRLSQAAMLQAPSQAIATVLAEFYQAHLEASSPNAEARVDDLRQLGDYALQYPDLRAFLADIALLSELSAVDIEAGSEVDEYVTLSSVHRAKGLEWRAVFVVWLAEGSFPTRQSLQETAAEEEERRCFYVAVTRAKDELYLSYPLLAAPRDRERELLRPSRFLDELGSDDPLPYEKWSLDEEPPPAVAPPVSRAELAAHSQLLLGEGEPEDPTGSDDP